ncbi:putative nonsense-mediated mRNA decay factor [Dipodascopsis uninucleata]
MTESSNDDDRRRQRRLELYNSNILAWGGEKGLIKVSSSLDSSLKKNTAFIKRLRTSINADNQKSLLEDIRGLSLEKYLSEIISAAAEGLSKCRTISDIWAGVEVSSTLHQRFSTAFTPILLFYLLRGFVNPSNTQLATLTPEQREKEDSARLTRQRALLRLLTEFWLCGLVRTSADAKSAADALFSINETRSTSSNPSLSMTSKSRHGTLSAGGTSGNISNTNTIGTQGIGSTEWKPTNAVSDPIPLEVLTVLLNEDKDCRYVPVAVSFLKSFSYEILGLNLKSKERPEVNENASAAVVSAGSEDISEEPCFPEGVVTYEIRHKFRALFLRYEKHLSAYIIAKHRHIKEQEKRNNSAYMRSGVIFEDRQAMFEKSVKTMDKVRSGAQYIADSLGIAMPDLSDGEEKDTKESSVFTFTKGGVSSSEVVLGVWDDEDQKKFYEDIMDLKTRVPIEFLDAGKRAIVATPKEDQQIQTESDSADNMEEVQGDDAEDGTENSTVPQSIGAQVDLLINRIADLSNRESVDQLAYDYCFLNSKASRNKLVRALQSVPKNRDDLISFYARFIATLNKYFPDIGTAMVHYLQQEFRNLIRKRAMGNAPPDIAERQISENRARNVRYICELVKFRVVPNHVIFNCIKQLLDSFGNSEIETLCNMLESCGRFLFRNEETRETTEQMLQILWKKKTALNLDARYRILIENAFYYVHPPERQATTKRELSAIELYIQYLMYVSLNKKSHMRVLKQLRKLNWNEPDTVRALDKVFQKIWKAKYGSIHLFALIASCLSKYHPDFSMRLIDSTLERIRVGLELNIFKYNQQRIAEIKYLGEMYTYKMIHSSIVFDALYLLVGFGHEGGRSIPGKSSPLDPQDDYFRIRLVCTLLDTCGTYLNRGSSKKKLSLFLSYFQYYIFTKITPLPMDIEFTVQDTLQMIQPNMPICKSLEMAAELLTEEMTSSFGTMDVTAEYQEKVEEDEDVSEDVSDDDDEDAEEDADEDVEEDEEYDDLDAEDLDVLESDDDSESLDISTSSSTSSDEEDEDDEDDEILVSRGPMSDPVEDEEFDKEFAKMISESLQSRQSERRTLDVPLPMMRNSNQNSQYSVVDMTSHHGEDEAPTMSTEPKNIQFRLLTKRGNRQLIHNVEVPADSNIAISTRKKQQAEIEERQRIKSLVLNYERNG